MTVPPDAAGPQPASPAPPPFAASAPPEVRSAWDSLSTFEKFAEWQLASPEKIPEILDIARRQAEIRYKQFELNSAHQRHLDWAVLGFQAFLGVISLIEMWLVIGVANHFVDKANWTGATVTVTARAVAGLAQALGGVKVAGKVKMAAQRRSEESSGNS
jgi:hypothetical protein